MNRRRLTQNELEEEMRKYVEGNNSALSREDPFHDSEFSDEDYEPTESDHEEHEHETGVNLEEVDALVDYSNSDEENLNSNEMTHTETRELIENLFRKTIMWFSNDGRFIPRISVPQKKIADCSLSPKLNEVEIFLKIFPKSLMMYIAHCTNLRLAKFEKDNKKKSTPTDGYEIMVVTGVTLIMEYNRVPEFNNYWSKNESLANSAIKRRISRDRCKVLLAKMYFNIPEQQENASRLYYIKEIINCLKITLSNYRSEATFGSIDESLARLKGRSSLKQYL